MLDTQAYHHVSFNGLHGTYDDALDWLCKAANNEQGRTNCVMSLGSSIGNFTPNEASQFLSGYARILSPADYILIGLDQCQDPERVFKAYNDERHVTERFYRNGLDNANAALGYKAFEQSDWKVKTEFDRLAWKHHASYVAMKDVKTPDFDIKTGTIVHLEDAWKYSTDRADKLWRDAGLIEQGDFVNARGDYRQSPWATLCHADR
jgi:L-histidine Nalpha-methyltransferase / hercynylcysteine S-oxide synthase